MRGVVLNAPQLVEHIKLSEKKSSLICTSIRSLEAIQLLLGHPRLCSMTLYLGIEMDDSLENSEETETNKPPVVKRVCCLCTFQTLRIENG